MDKEEPHVEGQRRDELMAATGTVTNGTASPEVVLACKFDYRFQLD